MSEALKREFEDFETTDEGSVSFIGAPIGNDAEADEALCKIQNARDEIDFWKSYYKEQLQKIEVQAQFNIDNETARLKDYFDRVPHKVTKTKETYPLRSGKLVWKDQQPKYDRQDESVIHYLKENKMVDYIKVKEELDWAGLKKELTFCGEDAFVKETGEKVPGIKVIEQERIFTTEK